MSRQVVEVYIDSVLIGTISPSGISYEKVSLAPWAVTAGNHILKFKGTTPDDSTVFLDDIAVAAVP